MQKHVKCNERHNNAVRLCDMYAMSYNMLETLVRYGPLDRLHLVVFSGYCVGGSATVAMRPLIRNGLVVHRSPIWIATERGRLAWALEAARRERRRVVSRAVGIKP